MGTPVSHIDYNRINMSTLVITPHKYNIEGFIASTPDNARAFLEHALESDTSLILNCTVRWCPKACTLYRYVSILESKDQLYTHGNIRKGAAIILRREHYASSKRWVGVFYSGGRLAAKISVKDK